MNAVHNFFLLTFRSLLCNKASSLLNLLVLYESVNILIVDTEDSEVVKCGSPYTLLMKKDLR